MAFDFSVEPEFQAQLDWMRDFVAREIEPMDLVFRGPADPFDVTGPAHAAMRPLQKIVRERGLWACHLGPELGGAVDVQHPDAGERPWAGSRSEDINGSQRPVVPPEQAFDMAK